VLLWVLAGLVGGLVLGVVSAQMVAARPDPGVLKAIGYPLLILLSAASMVAGLSRTLADVAPTLQGEQLMLLVEVRWPASRQSTPVGDAMGHFIELAALAGGTPRVSKLGKLWLEDARMEAGRWIAPGAVELFTNRGERLLSLLPAMADAQPLLLPMRGTPAAKDMNWSDWLPQPGAAGDVVGDGFSYRYKVIPRSQPSRTETLGPFQIETRIETIDIGPNLNRQRETAVKARFSLRHHGTVVSLPSTGSATVATDHSTSTGLSRFEAVATLAGTPAALMVLVSNLGSPSDCWLVVDEGTTLRATYVDRCAYAWTASPLTNDVAWRAKAKLIQPTPGEVDRKTFAQPGSYFFGSALLDTGQRAVRHLDQLASVNGFRASSGQAPLGLSPDGRSLVLLGASSDADGRYAPALLDYDTASQAAHVLPIDSISTGTTSDESVDMGWLQQHYQWQRGPDGHDRLRLRSGVKPLPQRGVLRAQSIFQFRYGPERAGVQLTSAIGLAGCH
jgi:hypothetical protein